MLPAEAETLFDLAIFVCKKKVTYAAEPLFGQYSHSLAVPTKLAAPQKSTASELL